MKKSILSSLLMICAAVTLYYAFRNMDPDKPMFNYYQITRFDYYTIQTNIITGIWFITVAIGMHSPEKIRNVLHNPIIGIAVTDYITITVVVYWAVLVPIFGPIWELWNYWQHGIVGALAWLVYIFILPGKGHSFVSTRPLLAILIYPLCYLLYAMIKSNRIGKYIYPFLNPNFLGGIHGIILSILLITVFFFGVALFLSRIKGVQR